MRLSFIFACVILAMPASAARQQLDTLTPAQAISRAAKVSPKPVRAVFQLRVQSAKKSGSGYYLDSEKDYRSPANLGVAIRASAMPGLMGKYGRDLDKAFVGKTIKLSDRSSGFPSAIRAARPPRPKSR